jgi:hypothetical protein
MSNWMSLSPREEVPQGRGKKVHKSAARSASALTGGKRKKGHSKVSKARRSRDCRERGRQTLPRSILVLVLFLVLDVLASPQLPFGFALWPFLVPTPLLRRGPGGV